MPMRIAALKHGRIKLKYNHTLGSEQSTVKSSGELGLGAYQ